MHTGEEELGCYVLVAGSPGVPTSLSKLLIGHSTQIPRAEHLACGPWSGGERPAFSPQVRAGLCEQPHLQLGWRVLLDGPAGPQQHRLLPLAQWG